MVILFACGKHLLMDCPECPNYSVATAVAATAPLLPPLWHFDYINMFNTCEPHSSANRRRIIMNQVELGPREKKRNILWTICPMEYPYNVHVHTSNGIYPSFDVPLWVRVRLCVFIVFSAFRAICVSIKWIVFILLCVIVCYTNKRVHCLCVAIFYDVFVDKNRRHYLHFTGSTWKTAKWCGASAHRMRQSIKLNTLK